MRELRTRLRYVGGGEGQVNISRMRGERKGLHFFGRKVPQERDGGDTFGAREVRKVNIIMCCAEEGGVNGN
jgi:hypothetical protein